MLLGTITINNAVFYAYHGVSDGEKAVGAQFEIDVEMQVDIDHAASSDMLSDTLNYESVYAELQRLVTGRKYYLMEALATEIASDLLLHQPRIRHIIVCVRKPNAPEKGVVKSIDITLSLSREEFERWTAAGGRAIN